MRSVPLPFFQITFLWTRAREPGPVSPVKVDSPLPFPWTQRGEIYILQTMSSFVLFSICETYSTLSKVKAQVRAYFLSILPVLYYFIKM